MNKQKTLIIGFSLALFAGAASSFAASLTLTNGGLGQPAQNNNSFGIAVCNGGAGVTAQSVPITVTANNVSATVVSEAAIQPGSCGYSYVNYSQFNMLAGQTYDVAVTIDPDKTAIVNADNQATYSVTVPSSQPAEATASVSATVADNSQPQSLLASVGAIFVNFFTALKNLF